MVRDLGWRAALIEPVPFLYRLLKANARQSGPTAHITVHQLAVTAQTTVQTGRCAFQALQEKCFSSVTRRGRQPIFYANREKQMNPKLRRASSVLVIGLEASGSRWLSGREWLTRPSLRSSKRCSTLAR